ncbi:MAG: hypothetical protein JST68_12455 [Bacteroidetes bacterium]|nr:hypothetical protein [Bacteroidota bacterium]
MTGTPPPPPPTPKFYETSGFRTAIALFLVYSILLTLPSWLYFNTDLYNAKTLYTQYSIDKNKFLVSYLKIDEVLTWCAVCITSLIIIFVNTLYYWWSFKDELMEHHYGVKKSLFSWIFFLFLLWLVGTLVCSFIFFSADYNRFGKCLEEADKYIDKTLQGRVISADRQFSKEISDIFGEFVHHVEWFTIGTIILFIIIDILSWRVKYQQVNNTTTATTQTEGMKLLIPQKSFVVNQLLIIDIPVIIGILLISFFVSLLPKDDDTIFDSKFVFVAGGIGMHLIISQLIFLILNIKYKHEEYKTKHP